MDIKAAHLRDPLLEEEILRDGFVVFKELFTKDEVAIVKKLYEKNHFDRDPNRATMWNSLFDISAEEGLNASEQIMEVIKPKLDRLFTSFKAPVAVLMSKNIGEESICHLHRDSSILDESKFQYRNVWIPLTDTDETNGALYVVKGSNNFFSFPRPPALTWHYQYLEADLLPYKKTLYSKAGDCVVFLDKTLHGSHRNFSKEYRPVIFFGVLHPEAETLYYYYDEPNQELRAYAVGPEFYFRNDYSEPQGVPLRIQMPYNPPKIEAEEILAKLSEV